MVAIIAKDVDKNGSLSMSFVYDKYLGKIYFCKCNFCAIFCVDQFLYV